MKHRRSDFPPAVRKMVAARSGGVCELCGDEPAVHHHHRRLRHRAGPGDTHGVANGLHMCTRCHDQAHRDPKYATRMGVIVPSGFDPATEPVFLWSMRLLAHVPLLLGDDGSVTPAPVQVVA